MHEWIVLAVSGVLAGLQLIGSGLIVRLLHKLDALEEAKERHAREIRDTRQAISHIEGFLNMGAYPYIE